MLASYVAEYVGFRRGRMRRNTWGSEEDGVPKRQGTLCLLKKEQGKQEAAVHEVSSICTTHKNVARGDLCHRCDPVLEHPKI